MKFLKNETTTAHILCRSHENSKIIILYYYEIYFLTKL